MLVNSKMARIIWDVGIYNISRISFGIDEVVAYLISYTCKRYGSKRDEIPALVSYPSYQPVSFMWLVIQPNGLH